MSMTPATLNPEEKEINIKLTLERNEQEDKGEEKGQDEAETPEITS